MKRRNSQDFPSSSLLPEANVFFSRFLSMERSYRFRIKIFCRDGSKHLHF